jgi:hypothetical protein
MQALQNLQGFFVTFFSSAVSAAFQILRVSRIT